jgi:hypothetical protein
MFIQSNIKNATRSLKAVPKGSATVITAGNLLMWASGLAVPADTTAATNTLIGVANGSIAAADALTQALVIELFSKDVWVANSTNNSNAAYNGQRMILGADAGTVNNTGTDSTVGIVQQVDVYGPAANKQILVRFL